MYYTESQRKDEFTRKFQHQEKIYQQFVTFLKAIIPVVSEFDGKVVNVKLIRAFEERVSNMNISLQGNVVSIRVDYNTQHYKNVEGYLSRVDISTYKFSLSVNENKRLDSQKTIETIEEGINSLISEIAAILSDINVFYDEEVKAFNKIKEEIQKYEKGFSNRLRRSMHIGY